MSDLVARIEDWIELIPFHSCWEWMGALNHSGYGRLSVKNRVLRAHRVVYELLRGPIPTGFTLDHLCRNRSCVNPAHLEPVSIGENVMRVRTIPAANAARVECYRGHPFTAENTIVRTRPSGATYRTCRRCRDAKILRDRLRR